MSEALRAVLDRGFDALALNQVEAHTHAENTPSVAMLERLGFRREGTLRRRDRGLPPVSGG